MDPNTCFKQWRTAVDRGEFEEALALRESLRSWIGSGGFEPKWSMTERRFFYDWKHPEDVADYREGA